MTYSAVNCTVKGCGRPMNPEIAVVVALPKPSAAHWKREQIIVCPQCWKLMIEVAEKYPD